MFLPSLLFVVVLFVVVVVDLTLNLPHKIVTCNETASQIHSLAHFSIESSIRGHRKKAQSQTSIPLTRTSYCCIP